LTLLFFDAADGLRDRIVTGVQTCALPILRRHPVPGGEDRCVTDRPVQRICPRERARDVEDVAGARIVLGTDLAYADGAPLHAFRSEEHTSELQSRFAIVCRLLLE